MTESKTVLLEVKWDTAHAPTAECPKCEGRISLDVGVDEEASCHCRRLLVGGIDPEPDIDLMDYT